MDPRCKVIIFMGKTNPSAAIHQQQSMILIPMDAPGIKIIRPLSVFGFDDAPRELILFAYVWSRKILLQNKNKIKVVFEDLFIFLLQDFKISTG